MWLGRQATTWLGSSLPRRAPAQPRGAACATPPGGPGTQTTKKNTRFVTSRDTLRERPPRRGASKCRTIGGSRPCGSLSGTSAELSRMVRACQAARAEEYVLSARAQAVTVHEALLRYRSGEGLPCGSSLAAGVSPNSASNEPEQQTAKTRGLGKNPTETRTVEHKVLKARAAAIGTADKMLSAGECASRFTGSRRCPVTEMNVFPHASAS